jgi:hypothetical protein
MWQQGRLAQPRLACMMPCNDAMLAGKCFEAPVVPLVHQKA